MVENDKKSTYIDIMRHGACVGGTRFNGSTDVALSDAGWQHMHSAISAAHSRNQANWDICISSPRRRCADFAQDIAQKMSIPWLIEEDIREIHFGDWEGRSALELMTDQEKELGMFWQDPRRFTPANAETVAHFAQRIRHTWNRIHQQHQGKRILLISHGGVMRCLLCTAHNKSMQHLMSFDVTHAEILCCRLHHHATELCSRHTI